MLALAVMRSGDVVCGRYVLRELIGQGGMGLVYLASEPALGRQVAIKILSDRHAHDREIVAAFRQEAVAASRVRHPSSVAIIECNHLRDGTPLIVMEHVPGRSLGRVIAEESIPVPRAIGLMTQILSALDTAHRSGVVHADIKSDNFLVETIDGGDHVTLIDYGLARVDGSAALDGLISGTPEYLAPEVIRGQHPSPASDLYGAGVILYELLTGATPFAGGTTSEVLARQLDDFIVPPSVRAPQRELPAAFDRIAVHALAKDPRARFGDAAEMIRALRGAFNVRPIRDPPPREVRSTVRVGELVRLRRALGDALVRGGAKDIEDGYAALAAALIRSRHYTAAIDELEEGIELLGRHGPTYQLVVALAAIQEEARRTVA